MILYKYQRINDRTIEDLKQKRLWKSYPQSFNDPFELRLMQLSEEIGLQKVKLENPKLGNRSDAEFLELIEDFQKYLYSVRVITFSEKKDDILMWAHYAGDHKGMCLGFEIESSETVGLFPVDYCDDYPKLNFDKLLEDDGIFKIMINKSTHWSYEKEWRKIFATIPGFPDPHPGDFCKYPGKLIEMILGARIREGDEILIKDILKNEDVSIKRATLHPNKYQLVISNC